MKRLLCWLGWHRWILVEEIYTVSFYTCARCGRTKETML